MRPSFEELAQLLQPRAGRRRLVVAPPESGKSVLLLTFAQWILRCVKKEDHRLIVIDGHGPFAREVSKMALRFGHEGLTHDRLTDLDRTIAYKLRTVGADELTEKRELEAFITLLMHLRGHESSVGHAYFRQGTTMAWRLLLKQPQPRSLRLLDQVLRFGDLQRELLKTCTCEKTVRQFQELALMTKAERERLVAPNQRAFEDLLDGPTFKNRCDGDYEFSKIHVVEGSIDVAAEESRVLLGMILHRAIECGMRDEKPWHIICDEAISIVNPNIAWLLEQIRKFGVSVTIAVQADEWPEDMRRRIANACDEHWYGGMGDDEMAQRSAGRMLPALDPNKTRTTYRAQQFNDGFQEVKVGERKQLVGVYRIEDVAVEQAISLNEQRMQLTREIMDLDVGSFFVKRRGMIRKVTMPMNEAFPLHPKKGEELLERFLEEQKQRLKPVAKPKKPVKGPKDLL